MKRPGVSRRTVLVAGGALLLGCSRIRDVDEFELRLATGPAGAVYRRIGGALAEQIAEELPGATVVTVPSGASTDNIRMLLAGEVHLGLSSLDAVITAEGTAPAGLSAVCRLYDSHLHLVVLAGSPVRAVEDLTGLRVSFGARDSGTEFTSRRLVELAGAAVDDVLLDQASSAAALADGSIDAQFSLTGVPTPAISELAADQPIRLVPLATHASELAAAYPGPYAPATIPATAYDGVPATRTVAVPNVLLVRDDLPADIVFAVTETVFTRTGTLTADRRGAESVPEAWQINVRTGISTGPIPLHAGAAEWFRKQKR